MAIIFNGTNVAQDPLVSGTNIKTINSNSLLGSGNISIVADVSTAAVGAATAGLTAGAVGSYAMMYDATNGTRAAGATLAGSSLRYAGVRYQANTTVYQNIAYSVIDITSNSGTPGGTWRLMGYSPSSSYSQPWENGSTFYYGGTSLWLRIS